MDANEAATGRVSAAAEIAPAASGRLKDLPLPILTTCKARDLPILEITARRLRETVACRALYVVAPETDCAKIGKALGALATVISESDFVPAMTLARLRALPVPNFPQAAGWYFQQFLKLQFAFVDSAEDYYLIWDADTVPLRPIRFFDAEGRMLLTKATEYHEPYFQTYRNLFGVDANREFSLIAQHMVVQKSIAREMLTRIEARFEGGDNWAWKIMRALPNAGDNLFSEYETYGHYVKNNFPDRVRFIDRAWLRRQPSGGQGVPSERELRRLAGTYDYVAFERASRGWRRVAKALVAGFRRALPR
jgi:hypothetical protein